VEFFLVLSAARGKWTVDIIWHYSQKASSHLAFTFFLTIYNEFLHKGRLPAPGRFYTIASSFDALTQFAFICI
jgi:hypothetical protein